MADLKPKPQPKIKPAEMPMWMKIVVFYGRFAPSFTAVGYVARGLPLRPLNASFKGQTWLVTGATGGIGKGIALGAAQRGATVLAVGRNEAALKALAQEGGAGIVPLQFDLELVAANLALADEVTAARRQARRPRQQHRQARPCAPAHSGRVRGHIRAEPARSLRVDRETHRCRRTGRRGRHQHGVGWPLQHGAEPAATGTEARTVQRRDGLCRAQARAVGARRALDAA